MTGKLLIFAISTLLTVAPASAVTFLQFFQQNGLLTPFTLTNTGSGISISTNSAIEYKFAVPNALGTASRLGTMVFTASSTAFATDGGSTNIAEGGFSGIGDIFDTATGTLALHWTFGNTGAILVNSAGTGGTFTDSRPGPTEVVFSSPYLNFDLATFGSFSFGLSGATSLWASDGGTFPPCATCRIASNSASFAGTMDAIPTPTAPEPSTMALLGSALISLGLFGRKRLTR
ncbi:MAG: PEP-CTERM sorting domain-containing protein [Candidatus Solibacter sp.]|nr:PEP-CTERM sorting domain-containing protein [Candidatus Solibacter sp.]